MQGVASKMGLQGNNVQTEIVVIRVLLRSQKYLRQLFVLSQLVKKTSKNCKGRDFLDIFS